MQNEETTALAEIKTLQYATCTQLRQATSVLICNNSSFQLRISTEKGYSTMPDSIAE